MTDAREIYRSHAEQYDALVSCEDRAGNLLKALREVVALEHADVVELGAGTGRVTALLAPHVRSLRAFDLEPAMLEVARRKLSGLGTRNWQLEVADNARLPVAGDTADVSIAGWSYGHQTIWSPTNWRESIAAAVGEMRRVLRPGGTAIVIETLGTGHREPFTPPPELARYYALLRGELEFEQTWIRTDYQFASPTEGERLVRFFFGDDLAKLYLADGGAVLAECTGLWWWRKPAAAATRSTSR
ncbi:MAG TPA: class I SAM-dependent methyltransferase [Polyangiaceae bacterium]|nr:class I SAM-dependent methyltransferase [Polyangiaceae bacterium]